MQLFSSESILRTGRIGTLLWAIGLPGVIGMILATLPQLMRGRADAPPLWIAASAGILQSAILLALAVWAGARLAPKLGLGAPVLQALVSAQPLPPFAGRVLLVGLGTGMAAGMGLFLIMEKAPQEFAALQASFEIPLLWRVLYGGITEELLLRWGLMTVLAWIGWRFFQGGVGIPESKWLWIALVVSAVLFGMAHLPAAVAFAGTLDASLALYIIVINTLFGLVFGVLFWRTGLEAAMLAHATAHVVAYLASRWNI